MGNQKLSPKRPLEGTKPADSLEITKTVEPPPIDETVATAQLALSIKITKERQSRCRECYSIHCPHYKREYIDTLEPFDSSDPKYRDANR